MTEQIEKLFKKINDFHYYVGKSCHQHVCSDCVINSMPCTAFFKEDKMCMDAYAFYSTGEKQVPLLVISSFVENIPGNKLILPCGNCFHRDSYLCKAMISIINDFQNIPADELEKGLKEIKALQKLQ